MPLSTVLGAQSLVQPAVCTTATRPASPYTGQAIYDTTTATQLIWNGTAWVSTGGGLVCVKAETSFSGAASVTADGVFTSSYTNYMMWINYTTSGVNFMGAKLRASGTSNSANYTYQILQGFTTSATTSAVTAGSSQAVGYYSNSVDQISVVQIGNPQLAKRTSFVVANPGISGALNYNIQGTHTTSSAYDGIELLMDTGTMTGTYAIYGYAKTV